MPHNPPKLCRRRASAGGKGCWGLLARASQVDALIDQQSMETDPEKRRRLVWETERKLIEDDVRPVLFRPRAAVCNQPWVKGMTQMVNGIYNGWRFEDVWLDK